MSTAASAKAPSRPPQGNAGPTAEQLIEQRVDEARRALWWSELIRTVLGAIIGLMVGVLAWLVIDHWVYSPGPVVRLLCWSGFLAMIALYLYRRAWPVITSRVTGEYAAWALEQDHPDYRGQLTSYVTLKKDAANRGLRARVVHAIGSRAASLLKSNDTLPSEATGTFRWWIAAAVVLAVLAGYCVASPKSALDSAKRLALPLAAIDPARRVEIRDVQPGDLQTLAGRNVTVSADVRGLRRDEPVRVHWTVDGLKHQSELEQDPDSGRHVGAIELSHGASGSVRYTVEAGDAIAGPYHLHVENVPVVAIESVRLVPPPYTGRAARTTSSPAITAIDGTRVTIRAKANRPVERAEVQFNPTAIGDVVRPRGGRKPMTIDEDGVSLSADLPLRSAIGRAAAVEPTSYRIRVWDANDQANPDPIIYSIKVIPDLAPEVAIVVPSQSPVKVPLDAQQIIEVHAMDADFELQRVSLKLGRGVKTLAEPVIWKRTDENSGRGNQVAEFRFRPSDYDLRAGDVVRITATAIDNRKLPDDPTVTANQSTTDPIELRIVQRDPDLPEDPVGNDGLSRPDERPASDVDQQQPQGGNESQGQQSGAEGQQNGESSSQSEGGNQQQGSGQSEQSPSSEGNSGNSGNSGNQGDSSKQPADAGQQESAGDNQPGNQDQQEGMQDQQEQSGQQGQSGQQQQPGQQGQSEQQGKAGQQGQQEQSGQQSPSEQQGQSGQQQRPTGGADGQRGSDMNRPNSQSDPNQTPNTDPASQKSSDQQGAGSDQQQSDGMQSGQDGGGQDTAGQEGSANDSASQDGSGSPSGQDSNSGDSSETPPKHDGEAFERIKDYIEKQKNKPKGNGNDSQSSNSDPQQRDGGGQENESSQSSQQRSSEQSGNEQSGSEQSGSDAAGEDASQGSESSQPSPNESKGDEAKGNEAGDQDASSEAGDQGADESGKSQSDSGDSTSEQPSGSDQQTGESQNPPSTEGGDSGQPQPPSNDGSSSQGQPDSAGEQAPESSGSQNTGDQAPKGQPRQPQSGSTENSGSSSNNSGSGTMPPGEDAGATPPPPDLEYTKEATDMVLDYLEETRDQVDPELLKDLKWTEDDLRRFQQRWEKVRQLDQPQGQPQQPSSELEDALRSLGLQPNNRPGQSKTAPADSLRNLRDSGNRRKAPPSIRDAFDAFRRR